MPTPQTTLFGLQQAVPKTGRPKVCYRQYGGKSSLSDWIVSQFPPHRIYLEPFCGSCAVLFAKEPSPVEIVNDLDSRIINVFNAVRSRPAELAALLWATPYSPENWRGGLESPDGLEDARLAMAQSVQFYCGNGNTSTWAVDTAAGAKPNAWASWFRRVRPAAERLRRVQVLNEDAVKAISRVADKEDSLVYADPPYFGHENEYRESVDYEGMVSALRACRGRVVVSEFPEARPFFGGWREVAVEVSTSVGTGASSDNRTKTKVEVLFCNF